MGLLNFFKKGDIEQTITKSNSDSIVFFNSRGEVIGRGADGFSEIQSNYKLPTFKEITSEAFGRSPWVYIIVDRIASSCMKMVDYTQLVNRDLEPISRQLLNTQRVRELVNILKSPNTSINQNLTIKDLVYTCVSNYLLTGNGYILGLPVNSEGRYTDLIAPLAQNVSINEDARAGIQSYTVNYFNLTFMAGVSDVMHMRKPNITKDIYEGYAPMSALSNIWRANNALNSNEEFIHERRGANGLVYSKGERPVLEPERKGIQGAIDRIFSGRDRVGRHSFIGNEIGFIDLSKSFKDLQVNEARLGHRETIAAAYNYPVQLLNDTTSTAYNNMKLLDRTAYANAVLPVYDMFLDCIESWLLRGNFNLETVKWRYERNDIPELQVINTEATENNNKKIEIVIRVNEAISNGYMDTLTAINTLMIAGGFNEQEATEMVSLTPKMPIS